MHTLFLLSALLLAAAIGGLGALALRVVPVGGRRWLALVVLGAPPLVLGVALTHLVPRFWPECAPLAGWDRVASFGLSGAIIAMAAGAALLSVSRLVLVERLLRVCPVGTDTAHLERLAGQLGVPVPALRTLRLDEPLAAGGGLRRPTIVLSTWLLERLDARELEAVLSHELAHLARRDHLSRWLGRLLRDAALYLPSGWYALGVLETEEELGADAAAVGVTHRPLAMASALGKVWRAPPSTRSPRRLGVASLPGYGAASVALLEERLARLLDGRAEQRPWTVRGRLLAGASVLTMGELTPRLLAASASVLPLVCTVRPG